MPRTHGDSFVHLDQVDHFCLVDRALRVRRMDELSYAEAKARFERDYLIQLLKLTDGNVSDAARLAQRNRTEFYRLLQRYDLVPAMFRSGTEAVGQGRHG